MSELADYLRKVLALYWTDRMQQVQSDINTAQNRAGATGNSRSSGLMNQLQEACELGLDDLFKFYLGSVRQALEAFRPRADKKLAPLLRQPLADQMSSICEILNRILARQAELIGFKRQWSVDGRRDWLLARAQTELEPMIASHAAFLISVYKPWYDKPLGRLAITALGGILAAIAFALIRSALKL